MSDTPRPDNLEPAAPSPTPPPPTPGAPAEQPSAPPAAAAADSISPAEPLPPATPPASSPPGAPPRTFADRILRAGVLVILAHLILKAMSLVLSVVLKRTYGLGVDLDAYNLVFSNILAVVFYAGEEALGPTFLATFMALKDGALISASGVPPSPTDANRRELEAWDLARTLFTLQTLLLVVIIALCVAFPEQIVGIWISDQSADLGANAVSREALRLRSIEMLRLMAGGLIGWSLGSLTYLLLNSYKIFFLAALGDAMLKIGVLVAVVLGFRTFGPQALSLGVLIGGLLKLSLHLWGLRKVGHAGTRYSGALQLLLPRFSWRSPGFKMFLLLLLPLIVGILMGKVRDWFYTEALTQGPAGLLSARNLGKNMFDSINQIVPYALSIAMYPFFCEMIDRGDRQALAEYLTRASRIIATPFVALGLLVFLLAEPITALLYYDSPADAEKVAWIAVSLRMHIFALPIMAVELFQLQAYFSDRRILHSQVIGVSFALLTIALILLGTTGPIAVALWRQVGLSPQDPIALIVAVGGIYTLVRMAKVLVLGITLRRYLPVYPAGEMTLYLLRLALLAGVGGLALYGLTRLVAFALPGFALALDLSAIPADAQLSRKHVVAGLALVSLVSLPLFLLVAKLTGMTEFREAWQYLKLKLQNHRRRS